MGTWLLHAQIGGVQAQSALMSAAGFAERSLTSLLCMRTATHKPPAVAWTSFGDICNMNSEVGKRTDDLGRLMH